MSDDVREIRAAQAKRNPSTPPAGAGRSQPFPGRLRAATVERDGQTFNRVEGYASVVETPYEMYDFAGPYKEVVAAGAFYETLLANPDVSFLVNHRGLSMARTTNGSLELSADDHGLRSVAYLNPKRGDVRDLVTAIEDGVITEMSFAFTIEAGQWSPDYTEYRIEKVNLDRGDVSAVNYGANPYTSVAARSREILAELDQLPAGAARAALDRLANRSDLRAFDMVPEIGRGEPEQATKAPARGSSVALMMARLLADDD